MTPEEETTFTEKLSKQYILIPKGRMYQMIGGAVAFVVAAFGLNVGTIVTYLHRSPAEEDIERIHDIRNEADKYAKEMKLGMYVLVDDANKNYIRHDTPYVIRSTMGYNLELHVSHAAFVSSQPIVLGPANQHTWKLVQPPGT